MKRNHRDEIHSINYLTAEMESLYGRPPQRDLPAHKAAEIWLLILPRFLHASHLGPVG